MAKKKAPSQSAVNEVSIFVSMAQSKLRRGLYVRQVTYHADAPLRQFDVLLFVDEKSIVTAMPTCNGGTGAVHVFEVDEHNMHPRMADCCFNINSVPVRVVVDAEVDDVIACVTLSDESYVPGTTEDDLPDDDQDLDDDESLEEDDELEQVDDAPEPPKPSRKGKQPAKKSKAEELPFEEDDEEDDLEDDEEDELDDDDTDDDEFDDDDTDDEDGDDSDDDDEDDDDDEEFDDDDTDDVDEEDDDEELDDEDELDDVEDDDEEDDLDDDTDDDDDDDDEEEPEDEEIDDADIRRILRTSNDRRELEKLAKELGINVRSTWQTSKIKSVIAKRLPQA